MKTIILLIIFTISNLGYCCSTAKKDNQNDRWNENCPYTEDNCGYPYESY